MIAIITDTHFGARNDSVPLMNSQQKFFETVFFPILKKYGVRTVLHGGDYVDKRKYFNFSTAQWVYKNYRLPMRDADINEIVLVGNHDCFLKHSCSINSIQEMYRDDESVQVISEPTHRIFGGQDMLLLPWICDENRDISLKMIAESKAPVVLGHLAINGFQMYRGQVETEGLSASLFDRFKTVLSGHFHHRSAAGPIQYLGAPYGMTWNDYNDPRGFHLFDEKTHALTFIENPYSIFQRLVYDDVGKTKDYIGVLCQSILAPESVYRDAYVKVVVKQKTNPHWFDLFLDSLYRVATDVLVVDEILVEDSGIVLDETAVKDTVSLMNDFVENLTINADKTRLKAYLSEIYHESMSASDSVRVS